jgi:hypothetical protein
MLELLHVIESGRLEELYKEEDHQKIKRLLVCLAIYGSEGSANGDEIREAGALLLMEEMDNELLGLYLDAQHAGFIPKFVKKG